MRTLLRTMFWCLLGLHLSAAADVRKAAAQDATAYQKACGDCHPAPAALARKIRGDTQEKKTAYLSASLAHHHLPDPATIDLIVGYLLTVPNK